MRISALLLILLALIASCNGRIRLVRNNRAAFNIVAGRDQDVKILGSAGLLSYNLERITGKSFRIMTGVERGKGSIVVGTGAISDSALIDSINALTDDGFYIIIERNRIVLAGKTPEATGYAVTTFLEEYAGCMKFTPTEDYVPSRENIILEQGSKKYNPAFEFRHPHFPGRLDPDFTSWHKISSFDNWGLFVHTFQSLCPPDKYFDTHPEYFSLVNGKRIRDGQLCLSNPEVIKILGDNLTESMRYQPYKKYWSVSQNDCINYCECDNCRARYDKYGTVSGLYIEMANALAERFPENQISTLAYQFTRKAPVNIIPHENVNIMFCSIECNRSMPLGDDPRSADFVADMKAWDKISDNIFMWDYVVQFKTYLCPFPNFHVLQPNIKFFRDNGASMMFQQGSGSDWSDMSELKNYLIAKLLWDPDLNADSVITRFCSYYYGPASEYILDYLKLTGETMKENSEKWSLDIYGLPSFYFNTFLTGELLRQYRQLMDDAQKAVENDEVFLQRVKKARCAVDFAYIDYALNAGDTAITFINEKNGRRRMNSEMTSLLETFIKDCETSGISKIGEEKLTIREYHDHIKTILGLSLRQNLAAGKQVKSLTAFNPRYSDPGVSRLNDGIFGGRHFNAGWLGYQGEDMIAVIDLGESMKVSRVSMNFLRDFVSWIFLPENVRIEISANGREYREVAAIENRITDRSFGVEPVYHSFAFAPVNARYIKVKALSMKRCPDWHRGAGQPSWIFCDEIIVE